MRTTCSILLIFISLVLPAQDEQTWIKMLGFENRCSSSNPELIESVKKELLSTFPAKKTPPGWFRLANGLIELELLNKPQQAIVLFEQAIEYFEKDNETFGLVHSYLSLAQAYADLQQANKLNTVLQTALQIAEISGSKDLKLLCEFRNKGIQFKAGSIITMRPDLSNYKGSNKYVHQEILEVQLASLASWSTENLLDSAESKFNKLAQLNGETGLSEQLISGGLSLVSIQSEIGDFSKAKSTLKELRRRNSQGQRGFEAELLLTEAEINILQKRYPIALEQIESAEALFESARAFDFDLKTWPLRIKAYRGLEQYKLAIAYSDRLLRRLDRRSKIYFGQHFSTETKQADSQENNQVILDQSFNELEAVKASKARAITWLIVCIVLAILIIIGQRIFMLRSFKKVKAQLRKLQEAQEFQAAGLKQTIAFNVKEVLPRLSSIGLEPNQKLEKNLAHQLSLQEAYLIQSSEAYSPNKVRVELIPALKQICRQVQLEASKEGKEIQLSFAVSPWTIVEAETAHLKLLLLEVLKNAIRYAKPDSLIELQIAAKNDREQDPPVHGLEFTLINESAFKLPKSLTHWLKPFNQGKRTDKGVHTSTGLGLAFVNELVSKHGGTLELEDLGNNTLCLNFWLPTYYEVLPAAKETINFTKEKAHSDDLVLPDGPYLLQIGKESVATKELLKHCPSDYSLVREDLLNNLKALLEHRAPVFIVTAADNSADLLELIEIIRQPKKLQYIPILMFGEASDISTKDNMLKEGLDDYIVKPFDKEQVKAIVQFLIASRESSMEALAQLNEVEYITLFEHHLIANSLKVLKSDIAKKTWAVNDLAKANNMKMAAFSKLLKATIGLSPSAFMREIRLRIARKLHEQQGIKDLNVLATKVGFENANQLERLMKIRFGISLDGKQLRKVN